MLEIGLEVFNPRIQAGNGFLVGQLGNARRKVLDTAANLGFDGSRFEFVYFLGDGGQTGLKPFERSVVDSGRYRSRQGRDGPGDFIKARAKQIELFRQIRAGGDCLACHRFDCLRKLGDLVFDCLTLTGCRHACQEFADFVNAIGQIDKFLAERGHVQAGDLLLHGLPARFKRADTLLPGQLIDHFTHGIELQPERVSATVLGAERVDGSRNAGEIPAQFPGQRLIAGFLAQLAHLAAERRHFIDELLAQVGSWILLRGGKRVSGGFAGGLTDRYFAACGHGCGMRRCSSLDRPATLRLFERALPGANVIKKIAAQTG